MSAVQFTLLCWLSVATLTRAQSCRLETLETNTTVADDERVEGRVVYVHGEEAPYKCRPGYEQRSPLPNYRNATCLNGTWQYPADPLICAQVSCERLQDPTHGKVIYLHNKTTVGSTVLFKCNYASTTYTARCLPGGGWDRSPPTCPEVGCERLKDPAHGRVIYVQNKTSVGSTVLFKCNYASTTYSARCLPGGAWDQSPPTCPEGCERLEDPARGKAIYVHNKTTVGSTVLFKCNYGSMAYNARCLPGGVWDPSPPICPEVSCERLKDLAHGRVIYTQNKTTVGSTVLFRCDYGSTTYSARCVPEGVWDQSPPTCPEQLPKVTTAPRSKDSKECPQLQDPLYGKLLSNGSTNSSAVFVCNEGYVMQGSSMMVCQPGGMWEPQRSPTCKAPFPWVIVAGVVAAVLVIGMVALVCLLCCRRRPTGYRRQIRKPSASDSHTQNEVAHLHKPYPVTSL